MAGFECGGWCPADRGAEDGEIPERYPLTPLPGAAAAGTTYRRTLPVSEPEIVTKVVSQTTDDSFSAAELHLAN